MGPSVSVLTEFDGMCFILSTTLLTCDEISCGICQQWMSFCEILPLLNIRVPITVLLVPSYFQYRVIFSQKNAKGQVLFDKICEKIELAERDYFGLRYIDEKDGQVQ